MENSFNSNAEGGPEHDSFIGNTPGFHTITGTNILDSVLLIDENNMIDFHTPDHNRHRKSGDIVHKPGDQFIQSQNKSRQDKTGDSNSWLNSNFIETDDAKGTEEFKGVIDISIPTTSGENQRKNQTDDKDIDVISEEIGSSNDSPLPKLVDNSDNEEPWLAKVHKPYRFKSKLTPGRASDKKNENGDKQENSLNIGKRDLHLHSNNLRNVDEPNEHGERKNSQIKLQKFLVQNSPGNVEDQETPKSPNNDQDELVNEQNHRSTPSSIKGNKSRKVPPLNLRITNNKNTVFNEDNVIGMSSNEQRLLNRAQDSGRSDKYPLSKNASTKKTYGENKNLEESEYLKSAERKSYDAKGESGDLNNNTSGSHMRQSETIFSQNTKKDVNMRNSSTVTIGTNSKNNSTHTGNNRTRKNTLLNSLESNYDSDKNN